MRENRKKVCSALDPDKENELEFPVYEYTLTVHDAGVNQALCAESRVAVARACCRASTAPAGQWPPPSPP